MRYFQLLKGRLDTIIDFWKKKLRRFADDENEQSSLAFSARRSFQHRGRVYKLPKSHISIVIQEPFQTPLIYMEIWHVLSTCTGNGSEIDSINLFTKNNSVLFIVLVLYYLRHYITLTHALLVLIIIHLNILIQWLLRLIAW